MDISCSPTVSCTLLKSVHVGFVHTNLLTLYHVSTNNATFLLFKKIYGYTLLSFNILPWKRHVVTERLISWIPEVEISHPGRLFGLQGTPRIGPPTHQRNQLILLAINMPAGLLLLEDMPSWEDTMGVEPALTEEIRNFIRPASVPGFSRRSWISCCVKGHLVYPA